MILTRNLLITVAATISIGVISASMAFASPVLPDPILYTAAGAGPYAEGNDYFYSNTTAHSELTTGHNDYATSSGGALLSPFPQLSATATSDGRDGYVAGGSVNLAYYVEVNGPSDIAVPLIIVAKLETGVYATGTGPAPLIDLTEGTADLYVENGYDPNLIFHACTDASNSCPGAVDINVLWNASANQQFLVDLDASASAVTNGAYYASAFALADPTFEIDPTFLAENPGYTLSFSPGIGNSAVASVPEPLTFSLFGAGLVGLGATARRRKTNKS